LFCNSCTGSLPDWPVPLDFRTHMHVMAVMMITTTTQAITIPAMHPAPHFCSTGEIGTGVPADWSVTVKFRIVGGETPVKQPPATLVHALVMDWNHEVELSLLRLFSVCFSAVITLVCVAGTYAETDVIKLPSCTESQTNVQPVFVVKARATAFINFLIAAL